MNKHKALIPLILIGLGAVTFVVVQGKAGFNRISIGGIVPQRKEVEYIMPGSGGGIQADSMMNITAEEDVMIARRMPYPSYPDDALEVENRVYQKSSYHQVLVKDVADYTRQIKEYVLSIGGRVLSQSISSGERYDTSSLNVKVPVAKFEEATSRVTSDVKKVLSEQINAQDRTGQAVAIDNQLSKLEEQKALKGAELTDAKTELEKTRIQLEIDRLTKQIEQVKQQAQTEENQVEYATLDITATNSESQYSNSPNPWEELRAAWRSMKVVLLGLLGIAAWIAVYAVIWLPVVLVVKWVGKMVKK